MSKNIKILFNYFLYFSIFIFICIIGASNVFAINYTNIGDKSNVSVFLVSTDYSSSPFNVPKDSSYAFAEVTAIDIQIDNFNFQANTNYQLEAYLYRQQLTNANTYSVSGLNGESCLISYDSDKTHFNGEYPRWAFQCPHTTTSVNIRIYNSSGNYLWSGTNVFTWSYTYLKSSTDPINSTSSNDSQNIIDNQNQNTQDIINNQNQNTQDIINNQNQNTQSILEDNKKNFQTCYTFDENYIASNITKNNYYLNSTGSLTSGQYWGIVEYIPLKDASSYTLKLNRSMGNNPSYCIYNENKTLISCTKYSNQTTFNFETNDFTYISISIENYNSPSASLKSDFEICVNKLDEQTNAINGLNDSLNDDSVDENGIADAFDDFNSFLDDNSTITQLITLPITLYTAILNNLNGTCQPFNLGNLYGESLILPCINVSQYLGSSLWTMIDIIISGFAVYEISKKMIKVFNNFSSLREGDVIDD